MLKRLTATTGKSSNLTTVSVELNGTSADEKLTPKMARRAARIAFGHSQGVTVWDHSDGYRLYEKSARKLSIS